MKKGVYCYLANRGIRNYYELFKSLYLLKKNVLSYNKADIIVFHEKNFNSFIRKIYKVLFTLKFQSIELDLYYKKHLHEFEIDKELESYGPGYRSMCFFFFCDFYRYLEGYRYYCRLDTDSFIIKKVHFDIFDYMYEQRVSYGYIAEIFESKIAVKNIDNFFHENDFLSNKIATNKLVFNNGVYNLRCIYTNFEVIDLTIFENEDIKKFLDIIVKSNNIFRYRWGDAPLRTIMISLFLKRENIVRFSGIDYKHQLFVQKNGSIRDPNEQIRNNNMLYPIAGKICSNV